MIRVLVVDDHGVVRKGIMQIVSDYPDMEVGGEARGGIRNFEPAACPRGPLGAGDAGPGADCIRETTDPWSQLDLATLVVNLHSS